MTAIMTSLKKKHDRLGLLNLPTVMNGALVFFLFFVHSDDGRGVDILFSIFALHIICFRTFPSSCPLCFRKVSYISHNGWVNIWTSQKAVMICF